MDLSSLPPRGTPGTRFAPSGAAERAVTTGGAAAGILGWIIGAMFWSSRFPPDGFRQLQVNGAIAMTVLVATTAGAIAGLGVAVLRGGDPLLRRPRALVAGMVWGLVISAPLAYVALLAATFLGPAVGGLLCIAAPLFGMRTGVRIARRSADGEMGAVPLRDLPPVSRGRAR